MKQPSREQIRKAAITGCPRNEESLKIMYPEAFEGMGTFETANIGQALKTKKGLIYMIIQYGSNSITTLNMQTHRVGKCEVSTDEFENIPYDTIKELFSGEDISEWELGNVVKSLL